MVLNKPALPFTDETSGELSDDHGLDLDNGYTLIGVVCRSYESTNGCIVDDHSGYKLANLIQ